jgi:hypothetical protein
VLGDLGTTGAKGRTAMMAAVSLDSPLAIRPKFLDCRMMASKAGHGRHAIRFSVESR